MTKILFVCHGNICRSPMAQYVMRHLVRERGLENDVSCDSAAATRDALGMQPHRGTRRVLAKHGIACGNHRARLITAKDGASYDHIIGMDEENMRDMRRILDRRWHHKLHRMLDWSERVRDVADPWYTGDYDRTFADIWEGCCDLLDELARTYDSNL